MYRWMRDDSGLGHAIRKLIPSSECALSTMGVWEMLIKRAGGRLALREGSLSEILEAQGFRAFSDFASTARGHASL